MTHLDLPHCITAPMDQCMFMTFNKDTNPNYTPKQNKTKHVKLLIYDSNM